MLSRLPTTLSKIFSQPGVPHIPPQGSHIYVALSGGVDSTVAAHLISKSGLYDVSGIYMRNWDVRDDDHARGCEWEREWEEVRHVCKKIGIPCELIDLSKEYWFRVFQPAIEIWDKGWTPNPDVDCNREVKFGPLKEYIHSKGSLTWLATGHYARLLKCPGDTVPPYLARFPSSKDQTYYLCNTPNFAFKRTYFPLGHQIQSKEEVKQIAHREGFQNWDRKESMGLCFVGERRRFSDWLGSYIEEREGVIRFAESKEIIGRHQGLWKYTIGQKVRVGGLKEKLFVSSKQVIHQVPTLFVAPASHPSLYTHSVQSIDFTWLIADYKSLLTHCPTGQIPFRAKLGKSSTAETACTPALQKDGSIVVYLKDAQYGISEGQTLMLSLNEVVLGGGAISRTFSRTDVEEI